MITAPARGPETDALVQAVRDAGILVGDHERPAGGGWPGGDTTGDFVPYTVLYQGITMLVDGSMADRFADTIQEYQFTSVGITRASASVIADRVRAAVLNAALDIPDRKLQCPPSWERGQPATRDDDVTPALFYVIDQYSIATTPA